MSVQRFSKANIFGYNTKQIDLDLGSVDSQWDTLTLSQNPTSVALSWPNAGGSPSSYEISISGTIINVGNVNSYTVLGLTIGINYNFKVRPVYANGSRGGWSYFKTGSALGFNAATGGTETTVSNYNGTGETWKVHTFNNNGTFTVTNSPNTFRVLTINQGEGGAGDGGRGGTGGTGFNYPSATLSVGNHSVIIGSSTGTSLSAGSTAPGNQPSSLGTLSGGTTLSGGSPGLAGNPAQNGGTGFTSDITGTLTYYAGGGGGGATIQSGSVLFGGGGNRGGGKGGQGGNPSTAGQANTGGGGGGGGGGGTSDNDKAGRNGGSGIVIVSYRIA